MSSYSSFVPSSLEGGKLRGIFTNFTFKREVVKMMHYPNHRHVNLTISRPSIYWLNGHLIPQAEEMISLLVGPNARQISLPRMKVWQHATNLVTSIDRSYNGIPIINLPGEDEYTWTIIAYWIDTQSLPPILDDMICTADGIDGEVATSANILVDIYAVATRFRITGVQAAIMDALQYIHCHRPNPTLPSPDAMNSAWRCTRGRTNQGIRLMFRDWCICLLRRGVAAPEVLDELSDEVVHDLWLAKGRIERVGTAKEYFEWGERMEQYGMLLNTGALVARNAH